MSRRIRAALLTSAIAAVLAGLASEASAMTMSLGDPTLTGKVGISVPLTVSCSPFDPAPIPYQASGALSVEQAVGKSIAHGNGWLYTSYPNPLAFSCDGADHTIDVTALADPAGPPFKRGPAVISVSASAGAAQQCGPNCFYNFVGQSASAGPIEVKIH